MARPLRLQLENSFYHITSRGDDRKKIFINERDYKKFLDYLVLAKEKFQFHLYAYCLMPNHYHLFLETVHPNLSRIMQYINSSYTTYYNIKRKKVGHVFQGRYKSMLVEQDSYFTELTRYIHLNPVRAKMVDEPQRYKWSSFASYINKRKSDPYIDKAQIGSYLDMSSQTYQQFVMEGIGSRDDILNKVYAGFLLGSTKFITNKLGNLKEQMETKDFAHKRKLLARFSPYDLINKVATKYGKDAQELCAKKKTIAIERKIAMYLIKKYTALTNREVGQLFMISGTAVIKSFVLMERLIAEDKNLQKEMEIWFSVFSA